FAAVSNVAPNTTGGGPATGPASIDACTRCNANSWAGSIAQSTSARPSTPVWTVTALAASHVAPLIWQGGAPVNSDQRTLAPTTGDSPRITATRSLPGSVTSFAPAGANTLCPSPPR